MRFFIKQISFFFLTVFMTACISDSLKVPNKYIQPEKMKLLLFDLYIADALNGERLVRDISLDRRVENQQYYSRIFQNYGITYDQFSASFEYYEQRPVLFDALTDSLNVYAQKMVMQGLSPKPPQKKTDGHHLQDTAGSFRRKLLGR